MCGCGHQGGVCGIAHRQVSRSGQHLACRRARRPSFALALEGKGEGWAQAGIIKDAGDDPDVTHGCTVIATVRMTGKGVTFKAGTGVGTVTKAGLPIAVGEPAINPIPREMMRKVIEEQGGGDVEIEISIPDGEALAQKTWNPRLGIIGGLSILGTTGIVHPFSCAAWIASIHRGVDVARAMGLTHIAGCTGSTSEDAVRAHFNLPLEAMMDMGDFAGGLVEICARASGCPRHHRRRLWKNHQAGARSDGFAFGAQPG